MNERSAWGLLGHRAFRVLWLAGAIVNLAIWMQTVGAAWVMTTLSGSPLMVALVQTAMSLPAFLFSLPGGVMADRVDRRQWLLLTQGLMFVAAALLWGLASRGQLDAVWLLLLTAVIGAGTALNMSAWMATIVSVVPRSALATAVSLNAVSTNTARSVGPALAGALLAWSGQAAMFLCIAGCLLAVIFFLIGWKPERALRPALPPESLWSGMRSGLSYTRHCVEVASALQQVFVFTCGASSLWALLPLVAREQLGAGAAGYGVLMGCLGVGAVIGALNMGALYRRYSMKALVNLGALAFALACMATALSTRQWLLWAVLVLAGVGWMAVNATVATIVQSCAAEWVRARVASIYLLVMMGGMALGGAGWGLAAQYLGTRNSLLMSALAIVATVLLGRRCPMRLGDDADYTLAHSGEAVPLPGIADDLGGSLSIEISYRVASEDLPVFLAAMQAMASARRRNGGRRWRLLRDLARPGHYIESFAFDSWLDYLRQNSRRTQGEQRLQARLALWQEGPSTQLRCELRTGAPLRIAE
jgi:MFS family permease